MTVHDLIIRNATVIDGSGNARIRADIAVSGMRIAEIGSLASATADEEIDGTGLIAAPGFIDCHTHDDRALLRDPRMLPKLSQGVTTVITGNCGISLAPLLHDAPPAPLDLIDDGGAFRYASFDEYLTTLEATPASVNAACLVGHTTLRVGAMSQLDRGANESEIAQMRAACEAALKAGAVGLSTGPFYPPAQHASEDELAAVSQALQAHGARYVTHLRSEDDTILDAMNEAFRIGQAANAAVVLSHHKVVGARNAGRSVETLARLDEAARTQAVCADCYPYNASSTMLRADRIGLSRKVVVSWSKPHPELAGLDLRDAALKLGLSVDAAVEALLPAGAIYFSMDETDVERILAHPSVMIGSDGLPHDTQPHPRLWGTFPRVLGHYVRTRKLFALETAVHKMTGMTAGRFGLDSRGLIRAGYFADITLFDAEKITDTATFDKPMQQAAGIHSVIVNGLLAWRNGAATDARAGRVLRHGRTA